MSWVWCSGKILFIIILFIIIWCTLIKARLRDTANFLESRRAVVKRKVNSKICRTLRLECILLSQGIQFLVWLHMENDNLKAASFKTIHDCLSLKSLPYTQGPGIRGKQSPLAPVRSCEKWRKGWKRRGNWPPWHTKHRLPSSVPTQEKTPLSVKAIRTVYYMISNDTPCHLVMSSTFKMATTIYLVKQACLSMDAWRHVIANKWSLHGTPWWPCNQVPTKRCHGTKCNVTQLINKSITKKTPVCLIPFSVWKSPNPYRARYSSYRNEYFNILSIYPKHWFVLNLKEWKEKCKSNQQRSFW